MLVVDEPMRCEVDNAVLTKVSTGREFAISGEVNCL